jgi:hypothetical protein
LEINKSEIEKLIEVRKKDVFLNHFFSILKHDLRPTGEICESKIKVWKQSLWTGLFYPVFIFHLNSNNHLTKITSKVNSLGKLTYVLFFVFLTSFFTDIDLFKIKFSGLLLFLVLYSVLISIFTLLSIKIYSFEKKKELEIIFETLKKQVHHNTTQ